MNLRSALPAATALAAALALCRWGTGGNTGLLDIVTEVQRGERLEPYLEASRRGDTVKRALATKVIARRMSLREAAGLFRHLAEADSAFPPGISPPGDEWFFCECALDHVWIVVADQKRSATGARWYAEAFRAEPQFLAGPQSRHRYCAACAAARAGCGQARDATDLDETSRAGFRRQALGWLRAELEARRRLLEQDPVKTRSVVVHDLYSWLGEPAFTGVRGADALARLPEAEGQAWQMLWTDVADTLARAVGMLAR
jgi:hypothetical protein